VGEQQGLQNDVIQNCDLPSSEIFRNVYWYFPTDVSGQVNVPIFKGLEIQKNIYLKTEMNTMLRVRIPAGSHNPNNRTVRRKC
jgi:hypothetical protein